MSRFIITVTGGFAGFWLYVTGVAVCPAPETFGLVGALGWILFGLAVTQCTEEEDG